MYTWLRYVFRREAPWRVWFHQVQLPMLRVSLPLNKIYVEYHYIVALSILYLAVERLFLDVIPPTTYDEEKHTFSYFNSIMYFTCKSKFSFSFVCV